MKVHLDTVGCRLNQAEIESMARQFRAAGHEIVADPAEADLAVVNTCAVTASAASDSRAVLRRAARAGVPELVAAGCWATVQPGQAAALPGVTRVVPNARKDLLVPDVLGMRAEAFDLEPLARRPLPGARQRTRAFIKVQDGCDNRCTFCVTTLARGPGRSRSRQQVLSDARAALRGGAQEIVLTGVHLGSWGAEWGGHLRELVRLLLAETDVPRLRLSSLEPWDLDPSFFALWEDPRLCQHLHLPLQSGCAATLRRMARKSSPESYRALVAAARNQVPELAITTDVIAGFPGETQDEFEASMAFVREMGFAGGHAFTYSPRPGTAAARMPGGVETRVRKARTAAYRQAFTAAAAAYRQRFLGRQLPVLWESLTRLDGEGWHVQGLTGNYLRVSARSKEPAWNTISMVWLRAQSGEALEGEILSTA